MKNLRYVTLVVLLVSVLGLSACSAAIPSAFSLVDNFVVNRRTAAPVAAAVVAAAPAPQLPAARPAAKALAAGDLQERLEEIYSSVNPSVVNIRVAVSPSAAMGSLPQIPGMPNFFGMPEQDDEDSNSPMATGEGSGFVWDSKGHIVTNNHVVDSAQKVTVTFADGTTVPATVVGVDPESDLAVIKVDTKAVKLQPINVGDSNNAKVGQFVVAIGNPFSLEGSMSFGIVSALGRSLPVNGENALPSQGPSYTIPDIIQTDAPVNPGNSGGVLLDLDGNLVGVPTAIESPVRGSAGVGFAVPSAIVKQVVPELIKNGKFVHPWIGISGGTLSPVVAKEMGLPETQRGALVAAVTAGGPAEKAGLVGSTKPATIDGQEIKVGGDVITAIDGQPVKRFEDLVTFLARNGKVGQTVKLTILRNGTEMPISLTLAARPGAKANQDSTQPQQGQPQATPRSRGNQGQPQATPQPRGNQGTPPQGSAPQGSAPQTVQGAWLGVAGVDMTADLAEAMELDEDQTGALIQQVVPNSPAAKAKLQAGTEDFDLNGETVMIGGDVVVSANGKNVETMQDLVKIVQGMKSGDKLNLTVLRDGEETKVTVTLATRPAAQQPAPQGQPQQGQPQATPQPRGNRGTAPQGQPQQAQPQATPQPRGTAPAAPQTAQGAWLGVAGIDMTADLAEAMELDADQTGALVQQVVPNSPAAKAGLKVGTEDLDLNGETVKVGGDVVVSANGKNVETMQDLVKIVQGMKSGEKLNLTVLRDGKEVKVTAELATRPAN